MSALRTLYIDANVLIEAVEGSDPDPLEVIGALRRAGHRTVTSELSLAEVLVKPLRDGSIDLLRYYERLIASDGLVESRPVDREVLRHAARIRAERGAKLPDCIHSATAFAEGCESIVSSDKRLPLSFGITRISTSDMRLVLDP